MEVFSHYICAPYHLPTILSRRELAGHENRPLACLPANALMSPYTLKQLDAIFMACLGRRRAAV
ncbi:hypothetical protein [Litchfieldella xinjiangensis]|uniref:hypothetical protein n=1 Tax=Litchfieldella xinjiangensis TaxID=1166948 RepID=UPI0018CCF9C1|nr:hypothetical protein [Halomonas xinjiangensis]